MKEPEPRHKPVPMADHQQNRAKLAHARAAIATRLSGLVPWSSEHACGRLTSDSLSGEDDSDDEDTDACDDGRDNSGEDHGNGELQADDSGSNFTTWRGGRDVDRNGGTGGAMSGETNSFFTPVLNLADMASQRGAGAMPAGSSFSHEQKSFSTAPANVGTSIDGDVAAGYPEKTRSNRKTWPRRGEKTSAGGAVSVLWAGGSSRKSSGSAEDDECLPKLLEALRTADDDDDDSVLRGQRQRPRKQQQQQLHRTRRRGRDRAQATKKIVPLMPIPMHSKAARPPRVEIRPTDEETAAVGMSPGDHAASVSTGDKKSDASWLECVAFSPT